MSNYFQVATRKLPPCGPMCGPTRRGHVAPNIIVPNRLTLATVFPRSRHVSIPYRNTTFIVENPQMAGFAQSNACLPCNGCCSGPIYKRSGEHIDINMDWSQAHQVPEAWRLMSVEHTVTLDDGSPLPGMANDLALKLDNVGQPMEVVKKEQQYTIAVVGLGVDGTDYRVTARTVWKDCDGALCTELEHCVLVSVSDC